MPSEPIIICITVIFMFFSFIFFSSAAGLDIYLSFPLLLIWLSSLPWQQIPIFGRFSKAIRFCFKIPKMFVYLILQDDFWVVQVCSYGQI